MKVQTTTKRIGGSTFALLPPELVQAMHLMPGQPILIDVRPVGKTFAEIAHLKGKFRGWPKFDRQDLWGV